jgi:gluconokinase
MSGSQATASDQPAILTIDVGSSSARAQAYSASAQPIAELDARETYQIETGPDGRSEISADRLLDYVCRCIDRVVAQARRRNQRFAAVALDTFVSNIMALDAQGAPASQLLSYADTRNDEDATRLRDELDEAAVHERTGCLLRTSYWPARLAWVRRTQPELWRSAARWATFGEYIELRLFGHARCGLSPASWSGLLNRHSLSWDAELLEHLGLPPERLNDLADLDQPIEGLAPEFATRWPELRAVPWLPALGDGAAANIGSGCDSPDRIALTVGTTGALRVVLPEVAQVPAGLWCYRVDRRRALLGGATSEGGNVYGWMAGAMQFGDPDEAERQLLQRAPDQHGLTVLPFWAGERSPGWAGNARATITGMTLATTPIDVLQATYESIAYRFALIAERLLAQAESEQGGESRSRIVVSGGSLQQSPAWTQIVADVLGRPMVMSSEPEATSRGVALLALEACGMIGATADLPARDGNVIAPRAERAEVYRAAIARQQELYKKLVA